MSHAAPAAVRRVACLSMAYNEGERLHRWVSYYGGQFGHAHLHVVDDGSTDGSTDPRCLAMQGVNVQRIPRLPFSDERRSHYISQLQTALLSYYDVVVFSDVDEFLVPDPARYAGLNDYCQQLRPTRATAVGFNLYHQPALEPQALDWRRPISAQRHAVRFASALCKTLVTRESVRWAPGFHAVSPPPRVDRDLYLFHVKYADRDLALKRQQLTREMDWDAFALQCRQGAHQRVPIAELQASLDEMLRGGLQPESAFDPAPWLAQASQPLAVDPEAEFHSLQDGIFGPMVSLPVRFRGCF